MPHAILDNPRIPRDTQGDLSDDSVSFQIPSQADSSNLLDDVEIDFIGAPYQTIDTPHPHRTFGSNDLAPSTQRQKFSVDPGPSFERDPSRLLVQRSEHFKFDFNSGLGQSAVETTVPSQILQTPASFLLAPSPKKATMASYDRTSTSVPQDTSKDPPADVNSSLPTSSKRKEFPKAVSNAGSNSLGLPMAKHLSYDRPTESPNLPPCRNRVPAINGIKIKHNVIGGGIVKPPKKAASKPSHVRSVSASRLPIPEPQSAEMPQSDHRDSLNTSEDTRRRFNASATSGGAGVAQQLLMIGQQFLDSMASQGIMKKESMSPLPIEVQGVGATEKKAQIATKGNDDPLTLSQLSPRKAERDELSTIRESVVSTPVSPMRPSKKRVSSMSEEADGMVLNLSGNGKIPDRDRGMGNSVDANILRPSRRKNGVASSSSRLLAKRLDAKAVPHRQSPIADKGKAKTKARARVYLPRTKLGASRDSARADKPKSDTGRALYASCPMPPEISGRSSTLNKTKIARSRSESTRSNELAARMEALKAENEEKTSGLQKGLTTPDEDHVIADLKVFHRARGASVNVRREQKVTVIPECFNFSTEIRAKEREKFDDHVRARQREIERQLEERRRQREMDEQKEIKEMRRRAVPKANEVPEWYANVPKRKRIDESAS